MKKILSLLLVTIMLFAVMAPAASAVNAEEYLPTVFIRGNGEDLYYPDGTKLVATLEGLDLGGDDSGIDKDTIVETAVNILKPFVLEGMMFDNWDNYGRAIYEELSPLFPDAGLDYDGNATKGTGLLQSAIDSRTADSKSRYNFDTKQDYRFIYDWRLSPYDHVDDLNTFIENILAATGAKQVNIWALCLGGSLLSAYLDEYGDLGYIKNAMFCEVLSNEATLISKGFSGQVEFDAKLVEKYMGQLDYCGRRNEGVGFVFSDLLNEIVIKTMDFFNQINVTDNALDGVEELYEKLYKALIPALLHATGMATQVNYWTCVSEEDMDAALDLVFGIEGSELRTKYDGLIKKIKKYRANISRDLTGFYDKIGQKVHFGFIANYGFLNAPFTKDSDLLSDGLVSLTHATMGATTAPVGQTLSDEYLAGVSEKNLKYISPDKTIDLSTAYAPDRTWVVKNAHHNNYWGPHTPLLRGFLNGTEETVESVGIAQFRIYDEVANQTVALTAENDYELEFMTRGTENPTTETRLVSFMRFFTMILNFFKNLFNGTLDFSNLLG